jgi:hypothetical protein
MPRSPCHSWKARSSVSPRDSDISPKRLCFWPTGKDENNAPTAPGTEVLHPPKGQYKGRLAGKCLVLGFDRGSIATSVLFLSPALLLWGLDNNYVKVKDGIRYMWRQLFVTSVDILCFVVCEGDVTWALLEEYFT